MAVVYVDSVQYLLLTGWCNLNQLRSQWTGIRCP